MTKNSSLFIRKTPLLFPRKSKVWKFLEIWAKIPFEKHSIEILLISAIFKYIKQFFEITHLLSRKSQAVERFQFSWAIILFERHSYEKYPCLAFLKTFKCFSGEKHLFFQKPNVLNVFRTHEHKWIARRIWKKLVNLRVFERFQNVFFSRYLSVFPKKVKIWMFWEFLSNNTIRDAFNWKVGKVSIFSQLSSFFSEQKTSFFPKNPNLNVWEPLSIKTFRDALSFPWTFAFLINSKSFSERIQILNVLRILE